MDRLEAQFVSHLAVKSAREFGGLLQDVALFFIKGGVTFTCFPMLEHGTTLGVWFIPTGHQPAGANIAEGLVAQDNRR